MLISTSPTPTMGEGPGVFPKKRLYGAVAAVPPTFFSSKMGGCCVLTVTGGPHTG